MWWGIRSMETTAICIWTWIWTMWHCGLGHEVACWFRCWKNWTCFVWSLVLLIWKWVHLFLRCWNWFSLLNSIGTVTLSLILKLSPRKLELWFFLWSFFLLKLLCISINIWFSLAWNNVVMSGLVLQTATRKC